MAGREKKISFAMTSRQSAVRISAQVFRRLAQFVARSEGVNLAEVDLAVVATDEMLGLNRRYLRHNYDTDVLSFDLTDSPGGISAQIVICADMAKKQGPPHGFAPRYELMLYFIHGLLHLMGYNDKDIRAGVKMHARQEELLRKFLKKPRCRPRKRKN